MDMRPRRWWPRGAGLSLPATLVAACAFELPEPRAESPDTSRDGAVIGTDSSSTIVDARADTGADAAVIDATTDAARVPGSVVWPTNGHAYLVVTVASGITWTEADVRARNLGGHLVTINSAAENEFVWGLLGDKGPGSWLGGFQTAGSAEPAAGWRWVTDEPFDYTNWAAGQPNDSGGGEDALHYISDGSKAWSDDSKGSSWETFTVELE